MSYIGVNYIVMVYRKTHVSISDTTITIQWFMNADEKTLDIHIMQGNRAVLFV